MSEKQSTRSNGQVERSVSEGGENTCPVCHDPILIFAVGHCDHPICHRCATRMRVLCEKNDCPICRSLNPQVAFVYHRQLFKDISLRNCIPNRKYKIFFEDEEVEDSYLDLLEYRCRLCRHRGAEKTFALLQTHMRREHQLFACELCVKFLKIFPYERKFYNRKNLATHRRVGDSDDKSYKGHPLCEFCDSRYYDKDELMKHLRKDHYFCHFCDQQGSNAYYDQYPDLLEHFSDSHYLCNEGDCANPSTRFTHAFVSEIDLKAHKAAVHSKNFTKAQSREARTLEVDFQLPPRRPGNSRGGGDSYSDSRSGQGFRGGDRFNRRRDYNQEDADMQRALEASKESFASESAQAQSNIEERVPDPVHDFPTLSGAAVSAATIRAITMQEDKSPEEDFPSLSAGRSNAQVSTSRRQVPAPSKAYSSVMNPPVKPTPVTEKRESKPVSLHVLSSTKKTLSGSRAVPPAPSEDDFPSLGGNTAGTRPASQGSWLAKSSSATLPASAVVASKTLAISKVPSKPISVTKVAPFKKPISDEKEFPALGGRDRNTVNGLHNSVSEWTTVQSGGSKKAVTPRSERVDDDSFELPQSYYTSLADPTASSNISVVNEEPEPVLKVSSRSAPPTSSSTKDFPGLPTRDKKTTEITNDKKQKKNNSNNKTKKARDRPKAQEKNPPEEANASLSEIAQALVQPQSGSCNRMNNSVRSSAKAFSEKQIDWFDAPSTKLAENSIDNGGKEEKCKDAPQINALSIVQPQESDNNSSGSIDESFPSLHSMSTSVQLQPQQMPKKPPGLPDPPSASTPSPPPGFGAVMNSVSSLKAISSTLTPVPSPPPGFTSTVPYIQPPDFKTRNTQLIAAIREALETVEDGFDNFRALSGQFRQGMMEASDYLSSIQALMGLDDFKHIFPELLALLPDVLKQKQLWELHQAARSFGLKGKGRAVQKSLQTSSTSNLTQCPTCGQVTVSRDAQHHLLQHGGGLADDENFPLLNGFNSGGADSRAASSNSSKDSSLKINGAWIKAK